MIGRYMLDERVLPTKVKPHKSILSVGVRVYRTCLQTPFADSCVMFHFSRWRVCTVNSTKTEFVLIGRSQTTTRLQDAHSASPI